MKEGKGSCISYFMCCWDKIPIKSNWTKERLFLADSSRAPSFMVGSHGRRRWGTGHIASTARQQRAAEAGAWLPFSLSLSYRPQLIEWCYPHLEWEVPPQPSLGTPSYVSRDFYPWWFYTIIKLAINVNHHVVVVSQLKGNIVADSYWEPNMHLTCFLVTLCFSIIYLSPSLGLKCLFNFHSQFATLRPRKAEDVQLRGNESQISNSEILNHCSECLSVLNQQPWTFQRAPQISQTWDRFGSWDHV